MPQILMPTVGGFIVLHLAAELCHPISAFDHRICTSYVDPSGLLQLIPPAV